MWLFKSGVSKSGVAPQAMLMDMMLVVLFCGGIGVSAVNAQEQSLDKLELEVNEQEAIFHALAMKFVKYSEEHAEIFGEEHETDPVDIEVCSGAIEMQSTLAVLCPRYESFKQRLTELDTSDRRRVRALRNKINEALDACFQTSKIFEVINDSEAYLAMCEE